MLSTLESHSTDGSDVDLKSLFGSYTMDVIAKSAFATPPTPYFVSRASLLFTFPFWRKFLDYVILMWLLQLDSFGFTVLPPNPMDFFDPVTTSAIRHRRAHAEEHRDFLQLLMKAEALQTEVQPQLSSKMLTEGEILAQSVLFFSVGFEISSQLLTYALYCLALNPQCQDKAYEEICQALSENPDQSEYLEISSDLLHQLPYLNAAIDESLRLYNPVLRMERRANQDYKLGDTGIIIPKGMIVGIPVWALHHSEEHYPEPFKFIPERFLPENRHKIVPSAYLQLWMDPGIALE